MQKSLQEMKRGETNKGRKKILQFKTCKVKLVRTKLAKIQLDQPKEKITPKNRNLRGKNNQLRANLLLHEVFQKELYKINTYCHALFRTGTCGGLS